MIFMARIYYSKCDPYSDWLLENYDKYSSYQAVSDGLNDIFHVLISPYTIKDWLHKHVEGMIYGVRGEWSEEDLEFLKVNYDKGHRWLSEQLGRSISSITAIAHRLGLRTDIRHQPQRAKRGSIRAVDQKDKPPRMMIKIHDGHEGWMPLARYVYTWHNGPIPEDGIIIFLDGDSTNCHISNLYCATPLLARQINNNVHYKSHNAEITKTLIKYYELRNAMGLNCTDVKNFERKFMKDYDKFIEGDNQ